MKQENHKTARCGNKLGWCVVHCMVLQIAAILGYQIPDSPWCRK